MKLKISVTKEILEESKMCGYDNPNVGRNCALALAVRDIFPSAYIRLESISIKGQHDIKTQIRLPVVASIFIAEFDQNSPDERAAMQPLSFEIDIPDEVINRIDITEVTELLKDHKTLQLV
jgi:hypothetical protein